MRSPTPTHAPLVADTRRVTTCGRSIDDVPLAPWSVWPTCAACLAGIADDQIKKRTLGLDPSTGAKP